MGDDGGLERPGGERRSTFVAGRRRRRAVALAAAAAAAGGSRVLFLVLVLLFRLVFALDGRNQSVVQLVEGRRTGRPEQGAATGRLRFGAGGRRFGRFGGEEAVFVRRRSDRRFDGGGRGASLGVGVRRRP